MITTVTPAHGSPLAQVEALAARHGWTLHSATESADNPNGSRAYRRGREAIVIRTWPHSGGVPSLTADLAAGRVNMRQFGRTWTGHNVPADVITEAFTGPRAESFPASPYVIVVESGEFIDRNAYATASNYNTVATVPGRYPVELLDARGRVTADVREAHRFVAIVPARIVGQYYVNRVFSATSAHDDTVSIPTMHYVSGYGYELADGYAVSRLDGLAAIVPAV